MPRRGWQLEHLDRTPEKTWEIITGVEGRRVTSGIDDTSHSNKTFDDTENDFVRAFCAMGSGTLIATYGSSIGLIENSKALTGYAAGVKTQDSGTSLSQTDGVDGLKFPTTAASPTLQMLEHWRKSITSRRNTPLKGVKAFTLDDDWKTKGDWDARYGRQYAVLCASNSPMDDIIQSDYAYSANVTVGPNATKGESVRCWIDQPTSNDERVLHNLRLGHRREAEWDDHGESYSRSIDGPDLWIRVDVPPGQQKVSIYFFNKDGHSGANRYRDYLVELFGTPLDVRAPLPTPLAHARVVDFWGGVYKSFVVNGPGGYLLRVQRCYSLNVIVNGLFLDKISGPRSIYDSMPMVYTGNMVYGPPHLQDNVQFPDNLTKQAASVFFALQSFANIELDSMASQAIGTECYRAFTSEEPNDALAENFRWKILLWTRKDRNAFYAFIKDAYLAHLKLNGK